MASAIGKSLNEDEQVSILETVDGNKGRKGAINEGCVLHPVHKFPTQPTLRSEAKNQI